MEEKEEFTHVIDLEKFSTPDEISKSYRSDVRRQIEKSIQFGLRHRLAENAEDINGYFAAYMDSVNRWKDMTTSYYKLELFPKPFCDAFS